MYLWLHRDKRSEAERSSAWLADWEAGGRAGRFHGVALHPWFRPASGDRLETAAQGEVGRERESFLVAPTATLRVVVVCICGGSDRESHSRQNAF